MSDDDQTPEEEGVEPSSEGQAPDADSLADEVAAGVDEAGGEDQALADEWAAAMEEAGETEGEEEDGVQPAPMENFKQALHINLRVLQSWMLFLIFPSPSQWR